MKVIYQSILFQKNLIGDYVEAPGNIMIIDDKNNKGKSNRPAKEAINYFRNMGIGDHWLVNEINEMFANEKYFTENKPTEEFFLERKSRLQKYFLALLKNNNVKNKEISLPSF